MKQTFKRIIPPSLWRLVSNYYWAWHNRGRHVLAKLLNPRWAESRRALHKFRDLHKGQRCFIIGNGPSLRQTDLSFLKGEITFGLNRIYLMFPELGFKTTYLVSVNDLVLEQCAEEIKLLELPKFITWRARRWLLDDPRSIFVDTDYTGPENFSGDVSGRVFEGFTVTYVALQLAYYMGFQEVILVGVDHNFVTQGPANSAVVSNGDDPNHFSPNYFGKGFKWQLPDLDGSERAYHLANIAYDAAGRKVLDATIGGRLAVFPKIAYKSLFG
ncbi:MAG: 6-hydroxymethylpterin diphosphokinase MptE-like protein [Anaerolineales bacterium]